jgi:Short C-terminal domain
MPGLLRGIARTAVVAGTASGVAGRVHHRQERKWAQQEQAEQPQYAQQPQYAPPPPQYAPPPPAPAAAPVGNTIQELKDLAALKDQGVLTDAEFAAQKAKILAG